MGLTPILPGLSARDILNRLTEQGAKSLLSRAHSLLLLGLLLFLPEGAALAAILLLDLLEASAGEVHLDVEKDGAACGEDLWTVDDMPFQLNCGVSSAEEDSGANSLTPASTRCTSMPASCTGNRPISACQRV